MKLLLIFINLFFFLAFSTGSVFGIGEFNSKYNVTYNVRENGITFVDQEITLTNLFSNLFPTKSVVILGSANIYNISAYDNIGKIFVKISKNEGQTVVSVNFNEKIVGLGKQYKWFLKYETPDLVSINGLIKEINIPKLELESEVNEYHLKIKVPDSFGEILYAKPVSQAKLEFTKEELIDKPVSIAFGKYQIFNFNLKYNLVNNSVIPNDTEIALPPDTDTQRIYLNNLTPKPHNVLIDLDGNWLAKYKLNPNEKVEVTATGSALIKTKPNITASGNTFGKTKLWLSEQNYWNTNAPAIRDLADKYKTPKEIYDYVVGVLKYDYERVKSIPVRYGALKALTNTQSAICMEFTDLFIAIARAAGIPARENDGYAYTNNEKLKPLSLKKDILHSWPEFYDVSENVWRQVDPTWENTTDGVDYFNFLDLNHFVLVKHGARSDYPYPAGAYKDKTGTSKDVEISFGNESNLNELKDIKLSITGPDKIFPGFNQNYILRIANAGNVSLPETTAETTIETPKKTINQTVKINVIPPFGFNETNIFFKPSLSFAEDVINIKVNYGNRQISKEVTVKRFPLLYMLSIIPLIPILLLTYYFTFYAKHKNKK